MNEIRTKYKGEKGWDRKKSKEMERSQKRKKEVRRDERSC